ncbi:MAG: glycosyltransferase family 4 protein [Armatimonadetes bacterium]|nr:glycosyltransferase family 4 protein [Armatimonadota bacterium]
MRIALVSQAYPPETGGGGISTQTHAKAHGMASLGHDVHVISHSPDASRHHTWDGDVSVIRIPGGDARLAIHTEPVRWLTYSVEVAVAVAELHSRAPLDLVDFPEYGAEGYVHLLNQAEWNHVRSAVQLHGPLVMLAHTVGWPEIDSDFYRTGVALEGACVRLADAVYSSSRCSVDWCAQYYGLDPERVPILHTGVDTVLFRPLGLAQDPRPTIVFVGKLVANKGVETLVAAACRLAGEFPDLRVRLIGSGEADMADRLQTQAARAGLPKLIDWPGFVEHAQLPEHLCQAHVFAAPSMYEGGPGFVYLEAMACGLPVIACAGSGAAEAIRDGETGLLVPPGDVEGLAQALRRLISDTDERETMGRRAREHVLAEADSRTCIRRVEAFYKSVVQG